MQTAAHLLGYAVSSFDQRCFCFEGKTPTCLSKTRIEITLPGTPEHVPFLPHPRCQCIFMPQNRARKAFHSYQPIYRGWPRPLRALFRPRPCRLALPRTPTQHRGFRSGHLGPEVSRCHGEDGRGARPPWRLEQRRDPGSAGPGPGSG